MQLTGAAFVRDIFLILFWLKDQAWKQGEEKSIFLPSGESVILSLYLSLTYLEENSLKMMPDSTGGPGIRPWTPLQD